MEMIMAKGSVFVNNRTQAVRLPAGTRFPDDIKQVNVRVIGKDRMLSPITHHQYVGQFLHGGIVCLR